VVVLASPGYPESPRVGEPIAGLTEAGEVDGVTVFHAGVGARDGVLVTAGGRVLNVVGVAPTLAEARRRAYLAADRVSWPGLHRRRDIALQAATRGTTGP
jgi:phosphoribosylamine---glycine ligase